MIVTIDGPAGSGKTTLAKELARVLELHYLDTGAMFRGLAFFLGPNAWDLPDSELNSRLNSFQFALQKQGSETEVLLNKKILGQEIRAEKIGLWASKLATLPTVRNFLKKIQQDLGKQYSLVAEGRDMGTVVFLQAEYKFFLKASIEERSRRRFKQLQEMGEKNLRLEDITRDLARRDEQDQTRALAPLRPAEDALILDTDDISPKEVLQIMLNQIKQAAKKLKG